MVCMRIFTFIFFIMQHCRSIEQIIIIPRKKRNYSLMTIGTNSDYAHDIQIYGFCFIWLSGCTYHGKKSPMKLLKTSPFSFSSRVCMPPWRPIRPSARLTRVRCVEFYGCRCMTRWIDCPVAKAVESSREDCSWPTPAWAFSISSTTEKDATLRPLSWTNMILLTLFQFVWRQAWVFRLQRESRNGKDAFL